MKPVILCMLDEEVCVCVYIYICIYICPPLDGDPPAKPYKQQNMSLLVPSCVCMYIYIYVHKMTVSSIPKPYMYYIDIYSYLEMRDSPKWRGRLSLLLKHHIYQTNMTLFGSAADTTYTPNLAWGSRLRGFPKPETPNCKP